MEKIKCSKTDSLRDQFEAFCLISLNSSENQTQRFKQRKKEGWTVPQSWLQIGSSAADDYARIENLIVRASLRIVNLKFGLMGKG